MNSEWISVTDRLPDEGEKVLIHIAYPHYHNRNEVAYRSVDKDGKYSDKDTNIWKTPATWFYKNVTHWMPLPAPPNS